MREENAMEKFGCAAAAEEGKVMQALCKLPPEYVRKVNIYADTLLSIFQRKMQTAADKGSSAAEDTERIALIGNIGRRLIGMDVEKLRRVDWYMDKIGA